MGKQRSRKQRGFIAVVATAAISFIFIFSGLTFAQTNGGDRAALEKQLLDLESQIADYEQTISKLKLEGKTLQSEIDRLNAKVAQANLKIKALNIELSKLDREIVAKQGEIKVTEGKIGLNRDALTRSLQTVYENGNTGLMEVLLRHNQLSDFFGDLNSLIDVQDSLVVTIDRIKTLRQDLVDEKEVLALKRNDAAALKVYQDAQRAAIQGTKAEKANLLTVTKGKESNYKKILQETKKTAAEIRSRIFQLLGGGELTFEQAYQFAKLAEGATGVRAALILAVLDRESKLGENVGRCSYKTAMHPTRDIPTFLELLAELKISPDSVTVSCANQDGAYGGAMGPAQFIPSTWKIYQGAIAAVTGNNPPSPWRHADAFVATGLYLKDAGATTNEKTAAARYYCGSRWNRYVCLNVYGAAVVRKAADFEDDIATLNS